MASGKKWHESDTIKFVKLYENAECLWNFRHPVYKHRNARDIAIQNIINEMNLPDFGVNELKNKIKNIRSTYQQEVNKIRRSKQAFGNDILEEYKTNLAWFPIADRFLGRVINSAKMPLPKKEEVEDPAFFPSNQPALYNLVETEMNNGEEDNEFEESFKPFTISIDQIKEEIDKDDYTASPTVTYHTKKRRLSCQPIYEGTDYKSGDTDVYIQNSVDEIQKDEWYHFGNNVSCQLRHLPLERALVCQKKIVDILTQERIDYITKVKNENKNSVKTE